MGIVRRFAYREVEGLRTGRFNLEVNTSAVIVVWLQRAIEHCKKNLIIYLISASWLRNYTAREFLPERSLGVCLAERI